MSHTPASITGIGLVTPAGIGRTSNWHTICTGEPTTRIHDSLAEAPVTIASTVPDRFDADRFTGRKVSRHYDRSTQLALVAAQAALSDAGATPSVRQDARVAVITGTAFGGVQTFEVNHAQLLKNGPGAVHARFLPRGLVNMTAGILALELEATGPNQVTSTACASGSTAIGTALDLLRTDRADIAITGGTDAPVTPLHIAGFHKLRALSRAEGYPPTFASSPFDKHHDGFVLAEGAGILILERDTDATARGTTPYAHLAGYGTTADAHHVTAPHPNGTGAKLALHDACHDAGILPSEIDHVNAHATSTPTGDAIEARLLTQETPDAVITSTKGVTGHTMGAAGAIEAAYTALSLHHQTAPPIANLHTPCEAAQNLNLAHGHRQRGQFHTALSTSFGFGGHNAALAFTAT